MDAPGVRVQVSAPPRSEPASQPGPDTVPEVPITRMLLELDGDPFPFRTWSAASATVMLSGWLAGLKRKIVQSTTLLPGLLSVAHVSAPQMLSSQSAFVAQEFLGETHCLKMLTPWITTADARAGNAALIASTSPASMSDRRSTGRLTRLQLFIIALDIVEDASDESGRRAGVKLLDVHRRTNVVERGDRDGESGRSTYGEGRAVVSLVASCSART